MGDAEPSTRTRISVGTPWQNGDLLAQPFDAGTAVLSGQPATIASGVRVLEAQRGLMAAVSRTGVLAWATSRATSSRITWFARKGRRLDTLPIDVSEAMQPRISPDGRRLAFAQALNGTADIQVYDFAGGTLRRVTQSPDYDERPV